MRLCKPDVCTRRTALAIFCAVSSQRRPAAALQVAQRSEEDTLTRALYSSPLPVVQSYQKQLSDAIPVKTLRGEWELLEYDINGRQQAAGTITFRGSPSTPDKGSVVYSGEAAPGRGPWILKSDGFGRSVTGNGGIIESKGVWKLRRGMAGTFTYEGRVTVTSYDSDNYPVMRIEGPVVELVNGGKPKGGSERKVGRFVAKFIRRLNGWEEDAQFDSQAAGGAPEEMQVVCIATTAATRCAR